jgi:hypothetical protein
MMNLIDTLLLVCAVVAALALAGMCGVGLVVWLAGGRLGHAPEAWRPAGKH